MRGGRSCGADLRWHKRTMGDVHSMRAKLIGVIGTRVITVGARLAKQAHSMIFGLWHCTSAICMSRACDLWRLSLYANISPSYIAADNAWTLVFVQRTTTESVTRNSDGTTTGRLLVPLRDECLTRNCAMSRRVWVFRWEASHGERLHDCNVAVKAPYSSWRRCGWRSLEHGGSRTTWCHTSLRFY